MVWSSVPMLFHVGIMYTFGPSILTQQNMALPTDIQLNLPSYAYRLSPDGRRIFDPVRKRYVALTPEEWVRQHLVNFLVHHRGVPAGLMQVEASLRLNGLSQRADVVVFDRQVQPLLVAECKAPGVALSEGVLRQAYRYNMRFCAAHILISNGLHHVCLRIDRSTGAAQQIDDVPCYGAM